MPDRQPVPPRNVRLQLRDGRVIPVECRYLGVDEDGVHVWTPTIERIDVTPGLAAVLIEMLPARTTVALRVGEEAGG